MLIKWVRCRVTDRDAFAAGQRGWEPLSDVPGFLGQCGGWSLREPGVAHVFAWWRSARDHAEFLSGSHDRLAAPQTGTYVGIDVRLFDRKLTIGAGPGDGSMVRLAHCHVRRGREDHFAEVQREVWNPGMTASGSSGGLFGHAGSEFLVLTWWPSEQDHTRYQRERFPGLREAAGAADDLEAVTGDLVALEPAWTVPLPM